MAKRAFDIIGSIIVLILLSPVMLTCALAAKLQASGKVFYRARRIGQNGKTFLMYKFRTMVENADLIGPPLTSDKDPRITKIGKFLRFSKLDELPQLFNVLKGEMSLVGPRPEAPNYVKCYNQHQLKVISVKPGMAGLAQLENRDESAKLSGVEDAESYYISTLMPEKLKLDIWYVNNISIWLDLKILAKTVYKVIFH